MKRNAVIASIKKASSDDLFLTIQLVVLNNKVNLNGVVTTKEFINYIVDNQEQFIHTPLFCDTDALRYHATLTHNFDERSGKFKTNQIGSFTSFSSTEVDGVTYLIGEVKVSKRNESLIDQLMELADSGNLFFSYEIEAPNYEVVDGIEYITAHENNKLVGVAVVSDPAIPEAKALWVAENIDKKEDSDLDIEEKNIVEEPVDEPVEKQEEETVASEDEKNEQIIQLSQAIEEKDAKIASLLIEVQEWHDKFEALDAMCKERDHAEAKQALMDKFAPVLEEEEMAELAEAFEQLDENVINAAVVNKLVAKAALAAEEEQVEEEEKENKPVETASFKLTDACSHEKTGISKWITL